MTGMGLLWSGGLLPPPQATHAHLARFVRIRHVDQLPEVYPGCIYGNGHRIGHEDRRCRRRVARLIRFSNAIRQLWKLERNPQRGSLVLRLGLWLIYVQGRHHSFC